MGFRRRSYFYEEKSETLLQDLRNLHRYFAHETKLQQFHFKEKSYSFKQNKKRKQIEIGNEDLILHSDSVSYSALSKSNLSDKTGSQVYGIVC